MDIDIMAKFNCGVGEEERLCHDDVGIVHRREEKAKEQDHNKVRG